MPAFSGELRILQAWMYADHGKKCFADVFSVPELLVDIDHAPLVHRPTLLAGGEEKLSYKV